MEKNKITDEDVKNEFSEISNGANKGLVFLVIILLLIVSLGAYIIYQNKDNINFNILNLNKQNEESKDVDKEPINEDKEQDITEEKTEIKESLFIGQILNTSIGTIIIDKNNKVYFKKLEDVKYKIETLKELGLSNKYDVSVNYTIGCKDKDCYTEAYKLDIEEVVSAYEMYYGNGTNDKSIILLTKDGKVNEILFEEKEEEYSISFHKNTFNNINIVSVLKTASIDGNYSILVDNEGNQYNYYGVKSMRQ